ncbi:hypothetical protein SAMN06297129_3091 [Pseudooceanicola antarcticus]|uniref:Glyceraldehyde-3-phosphate dehydrogenase n=1 Tax=Pseudooceanicola antarcticus TaxID=1247613 RepID=A0A285J691_9RHOB|nr:glyceraldehyde-3-phosphate dehydrogenase [Pseudooceanicola antarcticus]PJE26909.1 glyceraldehyde-3-phosphate dehydrogenase [Pseudooceanicola antarcticus]SNY55738.1 hypothetical protein SAMN06297129_3091 [Pseudooceanicola antarcticus]
MTNRLAFVLGVIIVTLLVLDNLAGSGETTLFLMRKFADFVEWLAFWR